MPRWIASTNLAMSLPEAPLDRFKAKTASLPRTTEAEHWVIQRGRRGGEGVELAALDRAAQRHATSLRGPQRVARVRSLNMRLSFCVDVQHERVGVDTELCDDERHVVLYQAADVVHVVAQPVELGDQDRSAIALRPGKRLGEHGAPVRVVLAALDLDKHLGD
jgi:hypothetical protein